MSAPSDIFGEIDPEQQNLLRVIYGPAHEEGRWPIWHYVENRYDRGTGRRASEILHSLPKIGSTTNHKPSYGLVWYADHVVQDSTTVCLTAAATLSLPDFQWFADEFIHALRFFVEIAESATADRFQVRPVTVSARQYWNQGGRRFNHLVDMLLPALLMHEPLHLVSGLRNTSDLGAWELTLDRNNLRQVADVNDMQEYVARVVEWVREQAGEHELSAEVEAPEVISVPAISYVDSALIDQLEAAQVNTKWNLKKLIQLCRELNANYVQAHTYACHALLRALLDHVPPVFGQKNFASVVNQCTWGQADTRYFTRINDFREQGHDALHRHIEEREDSLSFDDLPARVAVNRLVSEIVHILGRPTS